MNIRIYAIADIHGDFNLFSIPQDAQLVLIAGDVSVNGHGDEAVKHLNQKFKNWHDQHPQTKFCFIGGNHDRFLQKHYKDMQLPDGFTFLCDSQTQVDGIRLYGTSWCSGKTQIFECAPGFRDMQFAKIPEGLDVLISHAPPSITESTKFSNPFCLEELTQCVMTMAHPPKVIVCGHYHDGSGAEYKMTCGTRVINVARRLTSITL